jgi:hypothetical protein
MSDQMTGIVELKNRMPNKAFTWMWDSREFTVPAGGTLHCVEPAAWHGYSRSKYNFNPYTNEIEHLIGIVGKHDVSPIQEEPTELMNRKAIEEHDGMKSEVKKFANPIVRETTQFGNRTIFGKEGENPLSGKVVGG